MNETKKDTEQTAAAGEAEAGKGIQQAGENEASEANGKVEAGVPQVTKPDQVASAKEMAGRKPRRGKQSDEGFRDDFTEVDELRLPAWAGSTLFLLTLAFIIILTWACVSKVEKIVRAPGKFVTTGHEIMIRPLVDSIVESVDVHPGQVVHKGQKILTLDPTFAQSDLDQVRIKIQTARAIIYRATCELNNRKFTIPQDDPNGMYLLQYNVYKQRTSEFNAKMQSFDSQILSARESSRSAAVQLKELQNQIEYADQIRKMRKDVYEKGYDTKLNLLQAENAYSTLINQAESLQKTIAESDLRIRQLESDKAGYTNNWKKELTMEIAQYKSGLDTSLEQQAKAERLSQLVEITVPQESVVLEIGRISVGSIAKTGEALMTLVPLNEPIEAEVRISPQDVGFIRQGDVCKIKIDAFPFQKHGALKGVLKSISEDTISDGGRQGQGPYYQGRVSLASTRLENVPEDNRLMPGMSLAAEIVVGQRTVISYVLYPMISMFDESIREP